MPLLDHFRPPLSVTRRWESFHSRWAVAIGNSLNRRLPPRFFAETQVHVGPRVEVEVAEFDTTPGRPAGDRAGGLALADVPAPAQTLAVPDGLADRIGVEVRDRERDFRLVGAVELVSPGNKDRPEAREAFIGKAAGYLRAGVGLVVADAVSTRAFNLHNDLLRLYGANPAQGLSGDPPTYGAAYAVVRRGEKLELDVWAAPVPVGADWPDHPLLLLGFGFVTVNLEAAYREACEWERLQ